MERCRRNQNTSKDLESFNVPLRVIAAITMIYGACLTLAQTDAKRFCACSTISPISYSVFGIGGLDLLYSKAALQIVYFVFFLCQNIYHCRISCN